MEIPQGSRLQASKYDKGDSGIVVEVTEEIKALEHKPAQLFAWCSWRKNNIAIVDIKTMEEYANFPGVQVFNEDIYESSWTHVQEIPNTGLLVSIHHSFDASANMTVFDVSKKGQPRRIYTFEEVLGSTADGDVVYNQRRSILGAMSVERKVAYHLFKFDTAPSKVDPVVKLYRKSKWPFQYTKYIDNLITGYDFGPNGDAMAVIDRYGVCLVSDVNTNSYNLRFDLPMITHSDTRSRCRWTTNFEESLLFIKYDQAQLNILDVEKKNLIWKESISLEQGDYGYINWIDVCQGDGNLLVAGGGDLSIKVIDRRESRIVKTFSKCHSDWINCVRWNPSGDMLASASSDQTAKIFDVKAEKVLYTGATSKESYAMSCCFI